MNQQEVREILSGRRRGAVAALLRGGLSAAAVPYAAAMRVRRWGYRKRLLPSKKPAIPVICAGNITTGGTGKTPMVAWVVGQLKQAGRKPAILTRGYKGSGGTSDEAKLLRQLCDAPVIVNPDRVAGAKTAATSGADVCVMDDGFQHLRLRRDLDIALVDATNPFGYGRCLPRGLLREPVSALQEADAIVITRSDQLDATALDELHDQLAHCARNATLHRAVHKPTKIIDENGHDLPLDALRGLKVCGFCGVGNPEHFFALLESLHPSLVDRHIYDDHVVYTQELVDHLRSAAEGTDSQVLVTTQKDYVKFPVRGFHRPVWALAVEMEIAEGEAKLINRIIEAASGS
jgi:tetraacyldisaccharide 4'-kinase